ncbi:MAG: HAMP domain-containing protein [Gammaproteobacteria bacterium]|nr:HAMP domain-containing protein [Gammaproteobacteria bacterium]
MIRFLPQSLFGRLALILFSGLLLGQLASTAIQFHDRGQRLFQASGLSSSERIAEIVRLLNGANSTERKRLVSILNTPPLRVSLATATWTEPDNIAQSWPAVEFRKRLQRQLGDNYPLRVAISDQPTSGNMQKMHDAGEHDMRHMQGMGMALPDALVFFAQVRLSDGTWVSFENSIAPEVLEGSSALLLILAVLVAIVLFISLLAVRWVTRPLTMLTEAADKLGGNINQPPLVETGPTEFRHAAKAFNSMQVRLQRFIEDRTRLLTAISHDLKTPITRMRLRAEMLDDSEQRDSFVKNLDEMQLIATETLDFLRADDAREPLQTVDICALLEAIKDDVAELGHNIEIEPCILKPCFSRPLALKRCIGNLVENAIKYADNVRISTRQTEATLVITVSDSGPGIPEEKLETVFDPFYRLETSRNRETGGSGLGLSIARNIALSHGGDLKLKNNPDGGLYAILTLLRNIE